MPGGGRRGVGVAAGVFLGLTALLALSRGSLGLAIFHSSVLAVAVFAAFHPLRSSLAFGLLAAGLGLGLLALAPRGAAYSLCQTAALVLTGLLPSLFSRDEAVRRALQARRLSRARAKLDALQAELAQVAAAMEREHERARAANQALKRLTA